MQPQILVNFGLGGRTMILADKIIEERKKNGWTQEDLAQKLGVSRQSVSKWESAGAIPDLKKIILKAFVKGVRGYFSYYLRRFSLCFCLNNAFQPVLRSQTATMVKKHFDFIICFALLNHKNSIRFVFLRMVIWGG